jgi:hypothetical protein
MSSVIAGPEALAAASAHLGEIGSAVRQATAAAAYSTTQVLPAAQDEVSAAISARFGDYAQEYQALSAAGGGVSRPVRDGVGRQCVAVAGGAATGWLGSSPYTGPTMNVEAP